MAEVNETTTNEEVTGGSTTVEVSQEENTRRQMEGMFHHMFGETMHRFDEVM
jgi:hypothetical protein